MEKKYKLKKKTLIVLILIVLLIVLLISFAVSHLKNKSYSMEYNIDDYKISENYDNNGKVYYFEITYNNIKYNFITDIDYTKEKKLIEEVSSKEENGLLCLKIESDFFKTNPLCSKDKQIVDYRLYDEKEEIEPSTIENYDIYNNPRDVYLWSYKKLFYFDGDDMNEIKLFDKDIYDIPLATKINEYILIPDYEQEYSFDTMYIINTNNNKVDKWKLKYEISFDSYLLGINDKSVFILDKKNKREYELVPHKKKMRIVATKNKQATMYNHGELVKESMKSLLNNPHQFTYKSNYHYTIENNKLYLSYIDKKIKTQVSDLDITSIVSTDKDEVYYLVKDTLYKYNLKDGEKKMITYSDWEFNYNNLIFIK